MKRAWIWILAGLIAFVGVYTFVFPQSQMPVRINLTRFDEMFVPEKGSIYCDNEMIVTSSGKVLPLPLEVTKLPEGIEWSDPKVTGFSEDGDQVVISLNGSAFLWDGSRWSKSEAVPPPFDGSGMKGLDLYSFAGVKDGSVILALTNGDRKEYFIGEDIKTSNLLLPFSDKGIAGVDIDGFSYFPTDPTEGRIVKTKDGAEVARLDRSRLAVQSIPIAVATDGKSLYAMIDTIDRMGKTVVPVQVYDKDLMFVREFGNARQGRTATGIGIFGDFVLLLWDDGLLEGYSPNGYMMFAKRVANDGTGLMATKDAVFIKGKTWLGSLDINIVKPEIQIWPRFIEAGPVFGETTATLTIRSSSEPEIQPKGKGVAVIGKTKVDDTWIIQLLLDPTGLPAFARHYSELTVDMDNTHEIVPVGFVPSGKIRRFYIFDDFALDGRSGERLDLGELDKIPGMRFDNRFSREAVILDPEPNALVDK